MRQKHSHGIGPMIDLTPNGLHTAGRASLLHAIFHAVASRTVQQSGGGL